MAEVTASYSRFPKPGPVTMPLIQWMNDPEYRRDFGMWCYERFNELAREYKEHGRFLALKDIDNNPIEYSDLP